MHPAARTLLNAVRASIPGAITYMECEGIGAQSRTVPRREGAGAEGRAGKKTKGSGLLLSPNAYNLFVEKTRILP